MGTSCPSTRPIRRLKNGSAQLNEKTPEPSRKKPRCSGNRSGKRVRLTLRWSTSTSAKSVFTVTPARSEGVIDLLAPPADRPLEVDAPGIQVGVEVERREWDPDLHRPPVRQQSRPHFPDSVPALVQIAPAANQAVPHERRRVRLEEVPGAPVLERVQDPHEAVVGAEPHVALELVAQNAARVGVVQHRPDVQRVVIVEERGSPWARTGRRPRPAPAGGSL